MLFLVTSCSTWKQVPATMHGFKNGKGEIKGPIKEEELKQLKISIIFNGKPDVDEVIITPLNDGEETSYYEDGGIVRIPNMKIKNIFTFTTPTIWRILNTVFFLDDISPVSLDVL